MYLVDKVILNIGKYNDLEKNLIEKLYKKKFKYYRDLYKLHRQKC